MKWAAIAALLVLGLPGEVRADGDTTAAPMVLAQSSLAVIDAPKRLDIDQETVDFSGRAIAPGEVTLTVNGMPVAVAGDGAFRIRQQVPVGRSRLLLVLEGSYGDKAEHKVFVRRTTAATAEGIDYGTYYALVIGNNEYDHLTDLKMAASDARAVAQLLAERYAFEVETLTNATRYEIMSALARMRAKLTEDDNLLIYYAGHGSLDVASDEGYWLPADAERDNPANWLANTTISAQLRAMSAKHVMVIADSCYSGKLTRNISVELRTGVERTAWLRRMNTRRSRTALTSGGLEPVLDAGGGAHSVFAKALLEALGSNEDVLDGQSLFDAIKRPVVLNADQTPEYADIRKAGHDGGDFLFVPITINVSLSVDTAPAAPPAASIAPAEMALWQAIADSTNVNDYRAYLGAYPAGAFAPLARIRIESLAVGEGKSAAAQTQATELAFWNAIEDSDNAADYAAYLAQYPEGSFAGLARVRLDMLAETQTAALVAPSEASIRVDEMDATFVVMRTSNVRTEPTTGSDRIGQLARDDAVIVTGKVADKDWYRIAYQGGTAYVFGNLIEEIDPGEIVAWATIASTSETADLELFLDDFPDGYFAPRARSRLTAVENAERMEAERRAAEEDQRKAAERRVAEETRRVEAERKAAEAAQRTAAGRKAQERALWDTIKNSTRAADYQIYLEHYPNGTYAALARAHMSQTERKAREEVPDLPEDWAQGNEIETALLTPPPEEDIAITNDDVQDDARLKANLTIYLDMNRAPLLMVDLSTEQGVVDSIEEIRLLSISGPEFKVEFRVAWTAGSSSGGKRTYINYIATLRKSYSGLNYSIMSVAER